ncbi:hypothetical protein STHU_10100 [Allostella humosa]|nr:monovalent cation/H(+) antiporter subunit G [Stella humosa]BBK30376.1 hypothetical protein STHU_10100 [Stella humosa]
MAAILDLLAAACLVGGAVVIALAAIGLVRFPDPFTRMHAATKAGVVGSGLVLLGAGLALGTVAALLTALAAVLFLLATTPIASHLLGRAAYVAGAPIAPATIGDALHGVLDRKVFDIDPARRTRVRRSPAPMPEETAMTPLTMPMQAADPAQTRGRDQPAPVRRIVCWLAGAACQRQASAVALEMAQATGARLTALSIVGADDGPGRTALPAGGGHWARWLASTRRKRMRHAAAHAFAEFQEMAGDAGVQAEARHEEGGLGMLPARLAGADLVIVPAGIDEQGEPARAADELAARMATARLAPVLRVAQAPDSVRRVALLVGGGPGCARLAHAFIHGGLWPQAEVAVIPVGDQPERATAAALGQIELLQAHGRRAAAGDPLDGTMAPVDVATRLRRYDAAIVSALSANSGWFGAVRTDIHEVAADTVPLLLLP